MTTTKSHYPIRLLIADDHEMIREGFQTMFKKNKDIQLVGMASNGIELIDMAEELEPHVIITDIKMPKMSGVQATTILSERHPQIGIIAFTMYEDEVSIVEMLEAGAQGYLTKNATKSEIIEAILTVMDQKTYYCRETSVRLAKLITNSKFNPAKKQSPRIFSKREQDIIKLVCDGFFNREIAEQLSLSVRTVESYRERIQEKMEVKNTAGIVVYAIRKGLYKI